MKIRKIKCYKYINKRNRELLTIYILTRKNNINLREVRLFNVKILSLFNLVDDCKGFRFVKLTHSSENDSNFVKGINKFSSEKVKQ